MFGMETMSGAVSGLADNPSFTKVMTAFSNPIIGMVVGAVLTAIIQSSSASVGILQALCATGAVHYSVALPIIMGQNIGTCVTSIISSIGANKNARRAAMIHLYFNLIGTTLFMILFYIINVFVDFAFLGQSANAAGIALIHSLFNIGATICLFPFSDGLVKLTELTIPGNSEKEATEDNNVYLDERFLESPAFAMELCRAKAREIAAHIEPLEEVIDTLTKRIKENHIKRLKKGKCSIEMGFILEDILTGLERVSDHCSNIALELITIYDNDYNTHGYYKNFSDEERTSFYNEYEKLLKKYPLTKKEIKKLEKAE